MSGIACYDPPGRAHNEWAEELNYTHPIALAVHMPALVSAGLHDSGMTRSLFPRKNSSTNIKSLWLCTCRYLCLQGGTWKLVIHTPYRFIAGGYRFTVFRCFQGKPVAGHNMRRRWKRTKRHPKFQRNFLSTLEHNSGNLGSITFQNYTYMGIPKSKG